MFTAALFVMAKKWKQPRQQVYGLKKCMTYPHKRILLSNLKNEILKQKWIYLKITMLNETRPEKKNTV